MPIRDLKFLFIAPFPARASSGIYRDWVDAVFASGQSRQALGRPGLCARRPGRTVGRSPASEAHLTGPGRTADICRLPSDKM